MIPRRTLSAALAVLALAAAGCGGADGGTGEELDTPAGQGENSGAAAGTETGDE